MGCTIQHLHVYHMDGMGHHVVHSCHGPMGADRVSCICAAAEMRDGRRCSRSHMHSHPPERYWSVRVRVRVRGSSIFSFVLFCSCRLFRMLSHWVTAHSIHICNHLEGPSARARNGNSNGNGKGEGSSLALPHPLLLPIPTPLPSPPGFHPYLDWPYE